MRKFRNNKGFTLMETLLVIAIIAILAGIATGGVAGYRKKLLQLNYDTNAREIFISAQNHLAMAVSQSYLGRTDFGTAEDEDAGIYYFVVGHNEDNPNNKDNVLSLILPNASIDEYSRTEGSYIIRYQKSPAQILDVFYADQMGQTHNHSFTGLEYRDLVANYRGNNKANARRNYGPEKTVIGYYGGTEASQAVQSEKLKTPELTIENSEKLTAKVSNPNAGNPKAELKLEITGETSGKTRTIALIDKNGVVYSQSAYGVSYDYLNREYTIVLDDITIENRHFKQQFCASPNREENLLPGENIKLKATAYSSKKFSNVAESDEKTTNSLFASLKNGEAEIANFRQLENLSYTVSGVEVKITEVEQTKDLVWGKEESLFNTNTVIFGAERNEKLEGNFVPIALKATINYHGKSHRIEGINISREGDAGLFEELPSGSAVTELELVDFNVYSFSGSAGALAGSAVNSDITAILVRNGNNGGDNLSIVGSNATGGLVGKVDGGNIESCAAAVYVQSLNGNAGGLVGAVNSANITSSFSGGHTAEARYSDISTGPGRYNVLASENAGGLAGLVQGESNISYCYSSCSAHGSRAAGFVCSISEGKVTGCYSVGRASCEGGKPAGAFVQSHSKTIFAGANYCIKGISDNAISEKIDNVVRVSGKGTTRGEFIIPEELRETAYTYDDNLSTIYLGKYCFPTLEQLNPEIRIKTYFTEAHYGDWQILG